MNTPVPGILFALDAPWHKRTLEDVIVRIAQYVSGFKIGKALMAAGRSDIAAEFIRRHCPDHVIFRDDKDYDVENTLVNCTDILRKGGLVDMFSVSGHVPPKTLEAMSRVCGKMRMLVVTELTDSYAPGYDIRRRVQKITNSLKPTQWSSKRADGIICAPRDLEWVNVKPTGTHKLLLVTPAVRKPNTKQPSRDFRSATPREIVKQTQRGAPSPDYLVIGRAIYEADNPVSAAKEIQYILQSP